MTTTTPGGRGTARPTPRRAARPRAEALEGRELPYATLGGLWSLPGRITYSFVPDGTSVGGTPSQLFSTFNNDPNAPNWPKAFAQAAAVWQQVTGVNFVPVADDGVALGAGPDQQGDPNHGDIRIAGIPMDLNTLADTFAPPPINGGDLAGDILFNTNESWATNGNGYDLETVAIHELGHALGLAHSALTTAVMYADYSGTRRALTPDDVQGIQSLYGPQPSDPYANESASAHDISGALNSAGQYTRVMPGPLLTTSTNQGDWFYVQAPANTAGTMTVTMQATNFSLLQPDLRVDNASLKKLTEKYSYDLGATVTATVTGVTPGEGFYVRAGSAYYMPGRGAYAIQFNFGSSPMPPALPSITTIPDQPSQDPGGGGADSGGNGHGDGHGHGHGHGGGLDHLVHLVLGPLDGMGDSLTVPARGRHPRGPARHVRAALAHAPAPGHRGHAPVAPHHG